MLDSPNYNEAEITLIGTGGYGEAILIHIGNNNWVIVDSCIDPRTKSPLTLEYLKELNVDVAKNVKLIICTHWHDDHILGISKVLEACKSAKLSFAKAHDKDKFLRFVAFDLDKARVERANSSTLEFNRCLDIMVERGIPIVGAVENRVLLTLNVSPAIVSKVFSLSPSDLTVEKFDHEISQLITQYGPPSKKMTINSPNAKSVAIFLKLGEHRAILGADLEVSRDSQEGWMNIVNNAQIIDRKSSLFKIPHHGSKNGYCKKVWDVLLKEDTVAKLTPWNKGNGLPDPDMLNRYCSLTEKVFMTSAHINSKPKSRDRQIEKIIKKLNYRLQEIKYKKGIIRCRIPMDDANSEWQVKLMGSALNVFSALH